jgi:hypothetical protein
MSTVVNEHLTGNRGVGAKAERKKQGTDRRGLSGIEQRLAEEWSQWPEWLEQGPRARASRTHKRNSKEVSVATEVSLDQREE